MPRMEEVLVTGTRQSSKMHIDMQAQQTWDLHEGGVAAAELVGSKRAGARLDAARPNGHQQQPQHGAPHLGRVACRAWNGRRRHDNVSSSIHERAEQNCSIFPKLGIGQKASKGGHKIRKQEKEIEVCVGIVVAHLQIPAEIDDWNNIRNDKRTAVTYPTLRAFHNS